MKNLLLFCIYLVDKKLSYPPYLRDECKDKLRIICECSDNFNDFYDLLFKCLLTDNSGIYSDLINYLNHNYKLVKYLCN